VDRFVNQDDTDAAWHQQQMNESERWISAYDAANAINRRLQREDKPVDMTKYAQSDSSYLEAKQFVGKNFKVRIRSIEVVHFDATENKPERDVPAIMFEGRDKGICLNKTNTETLIKAYGADSDGWIGHEVGLSVADYQSRGYGFGWVVKPLDVVEPDFDDDIPF